MQKSMHLTAGQRSANRTPWQVKGKSMPRTVQLFSVCHCPSAYNPSLPNSRQTVMSLAGFSSVGQPGLFPLPPFTGFPEPPAVKFDPTASHQPLATFPSQLSSFSLPLPLRDHDKSDNNHGFSAVSSREETRRQASCLSAGPQTTV